MRIEDARSLYRASWKAWRSGLEADALQEAHDALIEADHLAHAWAEKGQLTDLLEPLLAKEEEPDVRAGSARQLLSQQVNESALATLRELRDSQDHRVVTFATGALEATAPPTPIAALDCSPHAKEQWSK